jgi:hydrogenase maturation protease
MKRTARPARDMQIICCGNPDRGDDSAALLVAEQLRESGMEVEIQPGDALDLIEDWDESGEVIVVDATVTGSAPGTIRVWDGALPEQLLTGSASTHGLGVAEAVYLAEILNRLPKHLRIYGIEGREFRPGGEISPEVREAAGKVAKHIAEQAVVSSR